MDVCPPWLLPTSAYRHASAANCSRHKDDHQDQYQHQHLQQQWSGWQCPPVSYSPHLRSNPLVNLDQRHVQSSCDDTPSSSSHLLPPPSLYDPTLFDAFDHVDFDRQAFCQDFAQEVQGRNHVSISPSSNQELDIDFVDDDDPPGDVNVDAAFGVAPTFPESFFLNPFAVSFPGDIPCPPSMSIANFGLASTPDDFGGPSSELLDLDQGPRPANDPARLATSPPCVGSTTATTTPTITVSANTMAPSKPPVCLGVQFMPHGPSPLSTTSPPSAHPPKAKTPSKPSTRYGPQIHFVDMADKKGAQRIRNTINSRRHRQNKLDKIRELEKRLAASEAEKESWQGRAQDLGWKQAP